MNHWQRRRTGKLPNFFLLHIKERTDHTDLSPFQPGCRRKAIKPALIKKRKQRRFDHIVLVMGQRNDIAAHLRGRPIDRAAAQVCTKGARILLIADFKNNLCNIRLHDIERHLQRVTICLYRRKIHPLEAQCDRHSGKLEPFRVKPFQCGKRRQKRKTVLSAGKADAYAVVLADQIVILHGSARQTEQPA